MMTQIGHGKEAALRKYRERLAWLAGNVGARNGSLLGLCNLGVLAGRADEQMLREIIGASGTPPLTEKEVWRAITAARCSPHYSSAAQQQRAQKPNWGTTPKPVPPRPLGERAASFVDRMIKQGEGATGKTLIEASPVPLPSESWRQTACFLDALYDDTDYLFCGEQTHTGVLGKNVLKANIWRQLFIHTKRGLQSPLLIANPLTGQPALTKEGKESLRCAASVRRHRYALVEFDAMPLEEQCAFWAGVIATGTLPLRSLVYSGGKSLHGLVEIGAADRAQWDEQMKILLDAVCNPNAPKERQADRACRNPDRMTRLAGSWRQDKGKTQTLIWLAAPDSRQQ
jgi:hypothetical protein